MRLGDRVKQKNGPVGVIVVSWDTNEYSAEYPKHHWEYLHTGILVSFSNGALVRFEGPEDAELLVSAE